MVNGGARAPLPGKPLRSSRHRRCQHAGNIFLVDFNEHRVIEDDELKARYTSVHPYSEWLDQNAFTINDVIDTYPRKTASRMLPSLEASMDEDNIVPILTAGFQMPGAKRLELRDGQPVDPMTEILPWLRSFGYTRETLEMLMVPMAESGAEPLGSMGNDSPLAILSRNHKLLPEYFKQLFAQVRRCHDLCWLLG
jgi:glutamate synthase (NADH)